MGLNQTTEQEATLRGSVKVELTVDNFSSLTDLGLGDGFTLTENMTALDANPDNGTTPDSLAGVASQTITFVGNLWEYNLTKLEALRGGIDILTNTPSALVSGASQVVAAGDWSFKSMILLTGQNADLSEPTINSVTGSIDGAGAADDWETVYNRTAKRWYLVPKDGANFITENQSLTIDSDYTPANIVELSTGGLSAAKRIGLRVTNKVDGLPTVAEIAANPTLSLTATTPIFRVTVWDIYYATINGGESLAFKNKDDTAPQVTYSLSILGKNKPTNIVGNQLYKKKQYIEKQV